MINIAICDDFKADRESLYRFLLLYSDERHIDISVKQFSSAEQLLQTDFAYSILFLDVLLDGRSVEDPWEPIEESDGNTPTGIDVALKLRENGVQAEIVFVSSTARYSTKGYDAQAFNYLIKPLGYEKVVEIMSRIIDGKGIKDLQLFFVKKNQPPRSVVIKDILYIQSKPSHSQSLKGGRTIIHSETGNFEEWETVKSLYERLPRKMFCQVQRGLIVNLCKIEFFRGDTIELANGSKIKINRTYYKDFVQKIHNYWKGWCT